MSSSRLGQTEEELQAMLAAQARAQREAFARFKRDCEGVRMLRTLERTDRGPIGQWAFLKRRIEEIPRIFARKRELERQRRSGEISLDEERRQLARLRREHGFPPGYALLDEPTELARARCAFSEFDFHLWHGPRATRARPQGECADLLRRFCGIRGRLSVLRRDINQKRGQIDYQRDRFERLRCDPWPRGVRRPADHARWCAAIKTRIGQLEAALSTLTATARGLRDQLNAVGMEYLAGCRDYPSCGAAP